MKNTELTVLSLTSASLYNEKSAATLAGGLIGGLYGGLSEDSTMREGAAKGAITGLGADLGSSAGAMVSPGLMLLAALAGAKNKSRLVNPLITAGVAAPAIGGVYGGYKGHQLADELYPEPEDSIIQRLIDKFK